MSHENFVGLGIFVLLSIAAAWIDIRERRIPDNITAALLALGLIWGGQVADVAIADRLIGAGVGFLLFWALGEMYFHRHKVEGLGLGDAKLIGGIGAWVGWQALPLVLLVSSLCGVVWVFILHHNDHLIAGKGVPFGPFLGVAGTVVLIAKVLNYNILY